MKAPDISVVMTFHRVGRLAHSSIEAAHAAISYAEHKGLRVEFIFTLDRPDTETEDICKSYLCEGTRMFEVDYGSVALTRNFGAERAEAAYLAHIDSDDLFSENWLYSAYVQAAKASTPSVFHPEATIHFEGTKLLTKAIESDDLEYLKERMWEGALWGPHTFASREIYIQYKFPDLKIEEGFGYEDWHWTCETLAAGVKHVIVPDTLLCYRAKTWKTSLYMDLLSQNVVLGRTSLYNLAFQEAK